MIEFLVKHIYINRKIIKYIISGGIAASVDILLLFILTDIFGVWYLFSAISAFLVAFFISFYLQKYWTFRDKNKKNFYSQMFKYFFVGSVNLAVNTGGIYLLVDKFDINYILAQIIMGAIIGISSFIIYGLLIFKKRKIRKRINSDGVARVLIATGIFSPDIGGPATYTKNLRKEFKKIGHKVKVVTYGEKTYKNKSGDIFSINRSQNIFVRYFRYFWKIYRLLDWADVFYTLDLISAGLPVVLVAKLKNKKVIFRTGGDFLWEKAFQNEWTDLPLVDYYKSKKNLKERFLFRFAKWVLKKFDLVIFSTNLQKDIYKKHYGIKEENIKLIPNALPMIKMIKEGGQKKTILFAGRFVRLKNIERLIKAFSNVKSETTLYIYGKGPDKNKLEHLIKKMNQQEKIIIMGSIHHEELIEKISESLFVILPSITEISPNLAIECISMGKPIILTKHTGLDSELTKEIITIDPISESDLGEKIEYLLDSNNLREYAEKLKRTRVPKREWSNVAADHLNIFNQIIK